jgi:sugar phosphate isomerase/epimerase
MNSVPAIQLFTVKRALSGDFDGTLTTLAAMGYRAVEFAWVYGDKTPRELADRLASLGIRACGFHLGMEDLLNPDSAGYAYARATSAPFVTTSAAGDVQNDWRGTVRRIVEAAGMARDQGFAFTYHNHAPEFDRIDGKTALDILYEETDPALVMAEIDVGFAFQRGHDPAELIRRYGSRVAEVHLRDVPADGGEFVELGNGTLDLSAVLNAADEVGAGWAIVEQSVCRDELASARASLETLQRLQGTASG